MSLTGVLPRADLTPPPLKPRKVWIVYSADHPLYVEVVLKFAQFLITACGTEVALDLLEEQVISEVGVMTWVSRQKQEMVESNSKIIILCSRGTQAKWKAILGWDEPAVQLRCDHWKPAGDLFTAAMNMILPDFKRPACFGTYIVCYFSGICGRCLLTLERPCFLSPLTATLCLSSSSFTDTCTIPIISVT